MSAESPGRLILTRESRDARYAELLERHLATLVQFARSRTLTAAEWVEWERWTGELGSRDPDRARAVISQRIESLDKLAEGRTFTAAELQEWERLRTDLEVYGVRPGRL